MTHRVRVAIKALGAAGVILLSVGIYFLLNQPKTEVPADQAVHKEVIQQIESLQREPVPEDPEQQAVYFATLAQNYEQLRDFTAARAYYLQAQAAIDAQQRQTEVAYYEDIARAYEQDGDSAKATEYLTKQKAHLAAFLQAHPDDVPTQDAIKSIEAKIREINQGVVY